MDGLRNNLEKLSDPYPYDLLMGIQCDDKNVFDSLMHYIESNVLNLILDFEKLDVNVRPIGR